jgi:cytochrome P450/NADPH-cytochrome P450 reductase
VFGCGHPDWATTYHAVPTTIDNRLQECGAERLLPRGEGNAAAADLFDTFDEWEEAFLEKIAAPDMAKAGKASLRAVVNTQARQKMLNHGEIPSAKIISNEIITHSGQQIKRHIVMRLEEGASYRTGDYLSLLPITPIETVRRVLKRFDLHGDDLVSLSGSGMSFLLPTEFPISAFDLFAGFVELAQPVSNKQVASLVSFARNDDDKAALERLSQPEVYENEVAKNRLSLLDILEEYKQVEMPLGDFILALPPLRMRQVRSVDISSLMTVLHFVFSVRGPTSGLPHNRSLESSAHLQERNVLGNSDKFPRPFGARNEDPSRRSSIAASLPPTKRSQSPHYHGWCWIRHCSIPSILPRACHSKVGQVCIDFNSDRL